MNNIFLSTLLLAAAAPAFADTNSPAGDKGLADAFAASSAAQAAAKKNPCLQYEQFNYFELMLEAAPMYSSLVPVKGAPPTSVILTMDRCEVISQDHVQVTPITPVAERWYTEGSFGLILTTELDSEKTWITVVAKRNGVWTTAGQMGEFGNMDMWDGSLKPAMAAVKFAHYEQGGVELPYMMRAAFRPSWSR